ncbi:MAG: TolC family protein [Verrucomicrobia bacterium]|nr:MAG: TolC family protein [Verrucomicrobiota bacterium]
MKYSLIVLARIFHRDYLRKPGSQMDASSIPASVGDWYKKSLFLLIVAAFFSPVFAVEVIDPSGKNLFSSPKDKSFISHEAALAAAFHPNEKYHLGSLIDLALKNNPMTRAAWSQAKAASASVGEARSLYYPWVRSDFVGGYDQSYLIPVTGPNGANRTQATVFLSMEYILLDFGRRDADVQRTIAIFHALGLTYQRTLQEVIFNVQKNYFSYEAALWKKKAAEANLVFTQTLSDMIVRQRVTGLTADPEELKARKRVLESQYEVESAIAVVRNTLGELCITVGIPANSPLEFVESEKPPSTKKLRGDANELIQEALRLRPDLAARVQELKASKEATKRAMSDFFPTIKIESQYANTTFGYQGFQPNSTANGYFNGVGVPYGSAYVTAHWDLFDGFDRVFKMKRRQEEDKVAEQKLRETQLDTTRDVWTAYNNSLAAAERVGYAEGFVASANEFFRSISAATETGLANVTDYSEAGSNLSLAQSELATAVSDYSTTLAALALAVGSTAPSSKVVQESLGAPGKVTGHLLSKEAATFKPKIAY